MHSVITEAMPVGQCIDFPGLQLLSSSFLHLMPYLEEMEGEVEHG